MAQTLSRRDYTQHRPQGPAIDIDGLLSARRRSAIGKHRVHLNSPV